jgi:hypothetical protein
MALMELTADHKIRLASQGHVEIRNLKDISLAVLPAHVQMT